MIKLDFDRIIPSTKTKYIINLISTEYIDHSFFCVILLYNCNDFKPIRYCNCSIFEITFQLTCICFIIWVICTIGDWNLCDVFCSKVWEMARCGCTWRDLLETCHRYHCRELLGPTDSHVKQAQYYVSILATYLHISEMGCSYRAESVEMAGDYAKTMCYGIRNLIYWLKGKGIILTGKLCNSCS